MKGYVWPLIVSYMLIYSSVSISQKILAEDDDNHPQQNNDRALRHCSKYQRNAYFDFYSAQYFSKERQFYFIPYKITFHNFKCQISYPDATLTCTKICRNQCSFNLSANISGFTVRREVREIS